MSTEKRLISYDVLIAHLDSCIEQGKGLFKSVCVAIKCFVEQMPTMDAVEVVRCKDCKYAENMFPIKNGCGHLMGDCTVRKEDEIVVMVFGDDFCSYGERRSDA